MFKVVSIYSALLFLACYVVVSKGQEMANCKEEDVEAGRASVMNIKECLQEAGAQSYKDVSEDKKSCFTRCVFMKKGIIDEMGMVKKEHIMGTVKEALPEAVFADALTEKLEKCFGENGSNLQTSGEDCDSFNPLMECFHNSFCEVCKVES